MPDCICDWDPPTVYNKAMHVARKVHRCSECGRAIKSGERYESVFGIWEGRADVFKTCARCLAVREFVASHIRCFCWAHGNMLDDAENEARQWAHETDGLLFGTLRRIVLVNRAPRVGGDHG